MTKRQKSLADELFPIIETTDDLSVVDIPPNKRRLHTETYDFSIGTIIEYLNKGNMFVPKFQRGYVWNRSQASRLIESLIIQCPIPVIYLNQEQDERLAIIDGNQRINSIRLFVEDEFELYGLTAFPEISGCKFSDLDPRFRRHIMNRTLRCITILKETHPQIKIDVFERINSGAVQLNPQEIRHGIYHGDLMSLVDDLSNEKIWKTMSGISNDNRMKGSELIIRFFAFLEDYINYKKPLKRFLNIYCQENLKLKEDRKLYLKNTFLSTIEKVNMVFEKNAFRQIKEVRKITKGSINAALFDAVMYGFSSRNITMDKIHNLNKEQFLEDYIELINEDKFNKSISSGTSDMSSVKYRMTTFKDFIQSKIV